MHTLAAGGREQRRVGESCLRTTRRFLEPRSMYASWYSLLYVPELKHAPLVVGSSDSGMGRSKSSPRTPHDHITLYTNVQRDAGIRREMGLETHAHTFPHTDQAVKLSATLNSRYRQLQQVLVCRRQSKLPRGFQGTPQRGSSNRSLANMSQAAFRAAQDPPKQGPAQRGRLVETKGCFF